MTTIADVLERRAREEGEKLAYVFLRFAAGDDAEETPLTYGELDRRSRVIARRLVDAGASGKTVLLALDAGVGFLASFFGCLYAGAIAVPAPRDGRSERLGAIAKDAGAELAIGDPPDTARAGLGPIRWLRPGAAGDARSTPARTPAPIAFLQYTSGSTADPKGVMVSHTGLMHNLGYAAEVEGNDEDSVSVSWLPHYHDMGLVEGILQPLYSGYPAYLFSPEAFLEKPSRWLSAISRYRATTSGAPNFAYDLSVRKTTPEERRRLDLRSWRVAYNGAEPVQAETLRSFLEAFEGCGFRWRSFYPVYGLAESTLVVTSPSRSDEPVLGTFEKARVGCGRPRCGVKVEIVDPRRRTRVPPGEVGEIWVSSESNALGYWNRPRESRRTFAARLRDTGEGPFLRTGDLGLLHEGELFVVGRVKDVVVVRGRKHHARDVEWTAERAHPAVRAGGVVVFPSERDDGAVLLAEVVEEDAGIVSRVRGAVLREHGLLLDTVALVPPRTLLKTSSGKLRRSACRKAYLEGRLKVLTKDARAPGDLDSLGMHLLARKLGVSVRDILEASGPRESVAPESDARLPADLVPEDRKPPRLRPEAVLLTGASGFLGAYLLRELLDRTGARLSCLVRGGGLERVRQNLHDHGLWRPGDESRIEAVAGDLARPRLGLGDEDFERFARTLDAIVHNGAKVNFVYPYRDLHDANVSGTLSALELAMRGRAKRFHFVSTLGVGYTATSEVFDERSDAISHLGDLHLGYAETKAVGEALVREASERGLTASVYRLALLGGAETTGRANENDFLSRFLRGCVLLGAAPDLDVELDDCPVDHAARAVAALALEPPEARFSVHHVRNEEPRHFRELVLFLNLFGYRVALRPYREWILSWNGSNGPLDALRPFFSHRVDDLFLPELFEKGRRARVESERTRAKLEGLGIRSRRSTPAYLERCFHSLIDRGMLPQTSRPRSRPTPAAPEWLSELLGLDLTKAELTPSGLENSILTEITSWHAGRGTGLYRVSVSHAGTKKRLFLKVKPSGRDVADVARKIAELCSPRLGDAFSRFEEHLGFAGTHRRELELYRIEDPRLRDQMPRLLGTLEDDENERFVLALEDLTQTARFPRTWSRSRIEAAIRGLARIHSFGFGRTIELYSVSPGKPMEERRELFEALFEHAAPSFRRWAGDGVVRAHEDALAGLGTWSKELESLPRTLLHNDFNPRNLCFRASGDLCAFDWELATLGPPQRDVAEILSFVLSPRTSAAELFHYLDLHRGCLERWTESFIDPEEFARGFELSLRELLVDRLSMYTLVHRFQEKPFLAHVVPTWLRLTRLIRATAAASSFERRGRARTG